MVRIAHRGNIIGPNPSWENWPEYVEEALNAGYDAEIDVWYRDGDFWLGHDYGTYKIDVSFLINEHLWCHAKNMDAFVNMYKNKFINAFWHTTEDIVLTTKNYIWCFPDKFVSSPRSIRVLPENEKNTLSIDTTPFGICSDYIYYYK